VEVVVAVTAAVNHHQSRLIGGDFIQINEAKDSRKRKINLSKHITEQFNNTDSADENE
jgi:hypothetical protein